MIQHKTIDGLLLRDMVVAGAALLEKNREAVDALNVFPVPDGDTGTNMSLTMQSATREVNAQEYLRADEAAAAISKGALKGARGNSGVITSQLLRGFATSLKGVEKITPVQFAQALKAGSDKAYKAVMKPKEGTILTVSASVPDSLQPLKSYLASQAAVSDQLTLTQPRHIAAARRAVAALHQAEDTLRSYSVDLAGVDLQQAQMALAEITGDEVEEKLLDEVFGRFCVGK